jgi:reactive intermediate/imine deaminase
MILVDAETLPKPAGHYSHAACAGDLIFLSGLLPSSQDGKILAGEPFKTQVRQTFHNLDQVLLACGSDRSHLAQVRVYLSDIDDWPTFNELYATWLGDHRPARCVVPVATLHYGVALEIEAIAQKAG